MAKMRISPELKKLIEKYRCVKDTEGMSPAKVYKLVGENENLYLKMTDSRYKGTTYDVEREKDMMLWLEGKLPVPKVLHFERHDDWSNLLMSEADGVLCSEEYEDEQSPEKIIELYAECIRLFHSIDLQALKDFDNIKVVFYSNEEIGHLGSRYSIKNHKDFYTDVNFVLQ